MIDQKTDAATMIIEGLVTTVDTAGRLNVAPMGPIVHGDFQRLTLRPFQPSTTFNNLDTTRCGVFHVIDDVLLIARIISGTLTTPVDTEPARCVSGQILRDCCRWFEFTVDSVDASESRSRMESTVVFSDERRPFSGFNRARHAVLEAAILATRLHLLPATQVQQHLELLQPAVQKTAGPDEQQAWHLLIDYIQKRQEPVA
ncbi:MAG: hypothetical protein RIT02_2938 [Planctomycetota bacterium]